MDLFTIVCYLITKSYTNLFVYNLDVFNLFNIYDTKSAREYRKCVKISYQECKTKYKRILKAK